MTTGGNWRALSATSAQVGQGRDARSLARRRVILPVNSPAQQPCLADSDAGEVDSGASGAWG